MNQETARSLAQSHLDVTQQEPSLLLEIGMEETVLFWFFRWNSREAVESRGARGYRATPWIAVEKSTGVVTLGNDPPPVTRDPCLTPDSRQGAEWIAQAYLDSVRGEPCRVLVELTEEHQDHWIVSWDSERHLETGRREDMLVGNAPLIVDRLTGAISYVGTTFATQSTEHDAS